MAWFVELIDVKDIDVAQPKYMYGHEAVRHKFKNGQNSIALTKFLIQFLIAFQAEVARMQREEDERKNKRG